MTMKCANLEEVLMRQEPEELRQLEAHAETCAVCRQQLQLEREISAAARVMHREWESPQLWPRIAGALEAQTRAAARGRWRWSFAELWPRFELNWGLGAAAVALVVLSVSASWLVLRHAGPGGPPITKDGKEMEQRLLSEQALAEVERNEAAYIASIEKLSALAQPRLEQANTPLLHNYREKLLVLDAAIAECRAQIAQNPFNAHLRSELLAVYQMKQRSLQELLQEN